jgi:predicted HTH domain antitoxin
MAARFAELPRGQFEGELLGRNIPIYRLRPGELEREVAAMENAGE